MYFMFIFFDISLSGSFILFSSFCRFFLNIFCRVFFLLLYFDSLFYVFTLRSTVNCQLDEFMVGVRSIVV